MALHDIEVFRLKPPIFVVGNVHSGTTLLQQILAKHPQVYTGRGETQFYSNLSVIRHRFPDLTSSKTRQAYLCYAVKLVETNFSVAETAFCTNSLETVLQTAVNARALEIAQRITKHMEDHQAIFFSVFGIVALLHGKSRWLEKTPAHLFYIDKILKQVPNARIVELVRDPRAILASKMERASDEWLSRRQRNQAIHAAGGYDPILHSLAWKSAFRTGNRVLEKYPENIMRLRYEDLIRTPRSEVRKVSDFIGITYDESMLDINVINSTSHSKQGEAGISAKGIDRWKTKLPESAIIICNSINRKEIGNIGYEQYVVKKKLSYLALPLGVIQCFRELVRIVMLRWRLRGGSYIYGLAQNYLKRLRNVFVDKTIS